MTEQAQPSGEKAVIETRGLCRDYGSRRALGPVDLAVPTGRVVALVGPNGAGKTTLLRLLMGLIEPTRGEARLLGHPARRLPAAASGLVAWLGDGHEPPRWAKLQTLMHLQREASSWFHPARATALLEQRGLHPSRRYGQLSKGQKRWALSALALASRPDVLIFDEPADGLDPAARRALYELVRDDVTDRGSTALIATHILTDIERVADMVIVMHHGLVRLHEDLETLREQVREVELPAEAPARDPGPGVELLARQRSAGSQILLVRSGNGALHDLPRRLGEDAHVRPVSLETLCLALTQPVTDNATDTEDAQEMLR
ncbi:MAG: ABC transporter ATP-binding protein [Phycisphaeraceae bacterium]